MSIPDCNFSTFTGLFVLTNHWPKMKYDVIPLGTSNLIPRLSLAKEKEPGIEVEVCLTWGCPKGLPTTVSSRPAVLRFCDYNKLHSCNCSIKLFICQKIFTTALATYQFTYVFSVKWRQLFSVVTIKTIKERKNDNGESWTNNQST